jgi:hypothetical protein
MISNPHDRTLSERVVACYEKTKNMTVVAALLKIGKDTVRQILGSKGVKHGKDGVAVGRGKRRGVEARRKEASPAERALDLLASHERGTGREGEMSTCPHCGAYLGHRAGHYCHVLLRNVINFEDKEG